MDIQTNPEERFKKVFESGKLVQVHVSMWSMAYQLENKDLNLDKPLPKIFQLGKKFLIDPEVRNSFKQIESRARTYLRNSSFPFPIGEAHFVPQSQILTVLEELNKIKAIYDAKTLEFFEKYEELKEKNLSENEAYRDSLLPCYPNLGDIRHKFSFSVSIFEIAFPKNITEVNLQDLIAQDEARASIQERMAGEVEAQKQVAGEKMNIFVNDCVQVLRQKVTETSQHVVDKLKNGDVITKASLTSLTNIVNNFQELNFFDDKTVEQELSSLKGLLESGADFKEDEDAQKQLSSALNSVLTATSEVSDVDAITGDFFRSIEV